MKPNRYFLSYCSIETQCVPVNITIYQMKETHCGPVNITIYQMKETQCVPVNINIYQMKETRFSSVFGFYSFIMTPCNEKIKCKNLTFYN